MWEFYELYGIVIEHVGLQTCTYRQRKNFSKSFSCWEIKITIFRTELKTELDVWFKGAVIDF